jgi:hypothetical protein
VPPAVGIAAGVIGAGAIGSALQSRAQRKAAEKARGTQQDIQERIFAREEERFDEFGRPLFERGLSSLDRLRELADFDPKELARVRLRDEFDLLNADLARTGNIRSGQGADLKLRHTSRVLADAQRELFQRQGDITGLALGQGRQAAQQSNALFQTGAGISSDIANLQLAGGAAKAGLFGTLGQLPAEGLLAASLGKDLFGGGRSTRAVGSPGSSIFGLETGKFGRF